MRNRNNAPHNREHHKTSSPNQPGLIAKGNKRQQSARTKSALDNHFHRTALPPVLGSGVMATDGVVLGCGAVPPWEERGLEGYRPGRCCVWGNAA
jgi:hypothetical protein